MDIDHPPKSVSQSQQPSTPGNVIIPPATPSGQAMLGSAFEEMKPQITPSADAPQKRKRSASVQNKRPPIQSETPSRPEQAATPGNKRSHKKGGGKAPSAPAIKPKGQGPPKGMITLKEGEVLPGGTLGM